MHAAAVAAIDIALWDLRSKALGVPVYDLLGGQTRDYARCYCHVQPPDGPGGDGQAGIDAMAGYAREQVAAGWRFVRFAAGEGSHAERDGVYEQPRALRWTVEAFSALRDALGPEVETCVDFHQRTTPAYAIQLARELAPMRPFFIEDPARAENPAAFARLRQHIAVPIATGEQIASKWEWRELIERDLIDYCRVDLCICGGLTEARKVAGWCETHYIEQVPHNPLGPVSTAACLHFDLATPLFGVQASQPAASQPGCMLLHRRASRACPLLPLTGPGHRRAGARPGHAGWPTDSRQLCQPRIEADREACHTEQPESPHTRAKSRRSVRRSARFRSRR